MSDMADRLLDGIQATGEALASANRLRMATGRALGAMPSNTNVILLALSGSRAYGTERPDSDVDLRGVYQASTPATWRLQSPQETIDRKEPASWIQRLPLRSRQNDLDTFLKQLRSEPPWSGFVMWLILALQYNEVSLQGYLKPL